MNKILYITLVSLLFSISSIQAQSGFTLRPVKKVEIPFEFHNNLIIVKCIFQRSLPVRFIFDTGAEHSILSKKEIADIYNLKYQKEFKILGSDMSTEITAYLVTGVQLELEEMIMPNRAMLVLKEDYLRFEEIAGMEIHGIIGADIFKRYVVSINYTRKTLTFTQLEHFKMNEKGFVEVDLESHKNKLYVKTDLEIASKDDFPVKLLVDTGAALSLLLHNNTHPNIQIPNTALTGNLAIGLGGDLKGYLGRVAKLKLGEFEFQEIITNFQEIQEGLDTTFLNGRNGLLGNEILGRFNVILNYPQGKLYLKPNRFYKKKFEFDKSGLVLIATGFNLNSFSVFRVMDDSPAAEVGMQKDDIIKTINGIPCGLLSLSDISRMLRKKEGKKIRLRVKRGKERFIVKFRLKKLI